MKVLAVTGGIGSGKSYICKCFKELGIPVYDSDKKTKELYANSKPLKEKLQLLLGNDIFKDGVLQNQVMAKRIFQDKCMLSKVEKIVHPAVVEDFNNWKKQVELLPPQYIPPFVIIESAIILEKPNVLEVADKVLTIVTPLETRIERVISRDAVDRARVLARLNSQWDDEKRMALSDFIIFADDKIAILKQIIEVYNNLSN